jgi:recombinational DNA repair protein (RecF pathway)
MSDAVGLNQKMLEVRALADGKGFSSEPARIWEMLALIHTEVSEATAWVADEESNAALLARYFELHLLLHVGYRPQLITCLICDKPVEPIDNYFSVQAGGILDPDCALAQRANAAGHASDAQMISLTALKVLRYLQTRDWQVVRTLTLDAKVMSEVEMLMERYIAFHLEHNLKSVEFLQDLKRAPNRSSGAHRSPD